VRDPLRSITRLEPLAPLRASFGEYRFQQATDPGPQFSGDLFDFLPSTKGWGIICFGDASGHGHHAARISSLTRQVLRSEPSDHGPSRLARAANRFLAELRLPRRFVSLWVGSFDIGGRIRFVDAGHGHWLILRADGSVRAVSHIGSIPLGIDASAEYTPETVLLHPGERLVLYSDGITDQRNEHGEEFGTVRLLQSVRHSNPACAAEAILMAAQNHAGASLADDASVAVIERSEIPSPRQSAMA